MQDISASALSGLPHGKEFRFLDEVTELAAGERGRGRYTIRGDEHFLRGHFPGRPLMPGVLLIEAVAQLAGVIVHGAGAGGENGLLLTAVKGAKILGAAEPGDVLEIEVNLEGRLGGLYQCSGRVLCRGEEILITKVMLSDA